MVQIRYGKLSDSQFELSNQTLLKFKILVDVTTVTISLWSSVNGSFVFSTLNNAAVTYYLKGSRSSNRVGEYQQT